jgi:glutamate racemase
MDTHKHVKAVVAACHTSSALALDEISDFYPFPLIGTIYPLAKALAEQGFCEKVGVLATPASAKSQVHEKTLKQSGFAGDVMTISCPEFVPFIEANDLSSPLLRRHAQSYLRTVLEEKVDTLIYGCTHYPLLSPLIRSLVPPLTLTIDPADAVADHLFECLSAQNLLLPPSTPGKTDFYCSWDSFLFQKKLNSIFSLNTPVSLQPLEDFLVFKYAANG